MDFFFKLFYSNFDRINFLLCYKIYQTLIIAKDNKRAVWKNRSRMNSKESPLSKQELFIHPISILQKQKAKKLSENYGQQVNIEIRQQGQTQNFNDLLLQIVDAQANSIQKGNSKTKHIFKTQTSLSIAQNKHKHYRTRMCPEGLECKKRLVCQFAHTQYELRRPYKNRKNPCTRYQKGLCSLGSACPDYHGNMDLKKKNYKYKLEKCTEWQEKGSCSKGKLCIFIHDEDQINEEGSQSFSNEKNLEIEGQQRQQIDAVNLGHKEGDIQQSSVNQGHQKNTIIENPIKTEPKDIFGNNSQRKKIIIAKQVVQQTVQAKQKEPDLAPDQEQNFNIEFNF